MNNWSWRNNIKKADPDEEHKDFLVFGYSSRIYPNDAQSDIISEERHMVPCWGDAENRVDRYDCRLLLHSAAELAINEENGSSNDNGECPTEAMEEEMCQEERYADLYKDIQLQKERDEEEERKRQNAKAEIGFNYGGGQNGAKDENDSDSEDEPFEAPEGIKFPVGLEVPRNMKQLHIIEKTASFVVASGAQMEIVIKAKQRNNLENFGFLDFDHLLYPFYKYVQKLIREKKYTPNLGGQHQKKKKTNGKSISENVNKKPALPSSLAAIAEAHASDSEEDSDDSDCELHPSLLGGGALAKKPSPEKTGLIGPRMKPKTPSAPINFEMKPVGDISERNDVYASLFKNLAHVTRQSAGVEDVKFGETTASTSDSKEDNEGRVDDPEYREWYQMYYHRPCPWIGPKPMLPATPDLEPILSSYAEYVARKGVEFEQSLAARQDLQLHFMDPKSPHFSYYHHKVRTFQWQQSRDYAAYKQSVAANAAAAAPAVATTSSSSSSQAFPINVDMTVPPPSFDDSPRPSSLSSPAPIAVEAPLNRRQRRRLIDSSHAKEFGETVPISGPGVIDPLSLKSEFPKSASTPAFDAKPISFTVVSSVSKAADGDIRPAVSLSSFSALASDPPSCLPSSSSSSAVVVEDSKYSHFDPDSTFTETVKNIDISKDEPTTTVVVDDAPAIVGLEPPPPPAIPNNTQLDRKEKARVFMEKLLQEKRAKKQVEEEQRMKAEEESIRKAEKISEALSNPKKRDAILRGEEDQAAAASRPKVSTIDEIINRRINSLLVESGFKPEETVKEKEKEKEEEDDGEKKKKKKHKKRSRSRSRSVEKRDDRKKSRRDSRHRRRRSRTRSRTRSRSPERASGRRAYRSRSRDRNYRR